MKEYQTEKGTTLYYKVSYDLGGYNYFTSTERERGYYLSIQRKYREFGAFSGLDDPSGAVRVLLLPVNRQSVKAEKQAEEMAEQKVAEIVGLYAERGVEL